MRLKPRAISGGKPAAQSVNVKAGQRKIRRMQAEGKKIIHRSLFPINEHIEIEPQATSNENIDSDEHIELELGDSDDDAVVQEMEQNVVGGASAVRCMISSSSAADASNVRNSKLMRYAAINDARLGYNDPMAEPFREKVKVKTVKKINADIRALSQDKALETSVTRYVNSLSKRQYERVVAVSKTDGKTSATQRRTQTTTEDGVNPKLQCSGYQCDAEEEKYIRTMQDAGLGFVPITSDGKKVMLFQSPRVSRCKELR